MTALVAAEAVLLALLSLLVAGLLRSHAEILRRLPPENSSGHQRDGLELTHSGGSPEPRPQAAVTPVPIEGRPLNGGSPRLAFGEGGPDVLLAFLSSGCEACGAFWESLPSKKRSRLPRATQVVVVTKGEEEESVSRLKKLAPRKLRVVMSTPAWTDFQVPGSPYFVFVDGRSGEVRGEGVANEWDQLTRLVEDAMADAGVPTGPRLSDSHPERIRQADRALLAAGIGPDHPSLWPGGPPADADGGSEG